MNNTIYAEANSQNISFHTVGHHVQEEAMKIERTHYKEWHEETVQIVSAAKKMQDTMTEEERSAADAESLAEFNRILAEAQAQKARTWAQLPSGLRQSFPSDALNAF